MSGRPHHYEMKLRWTGNTGEGTRTYRGYRRDHVVEVAGKAHRIDASSDPAFRGDPARWNPEELLVSSLSSCHMLWFLHLASEASVVVVAYEDTATGTMIENPDGSGQFERVTMRPRVTVTSPVDPETMKALHEGAHRLCFIARSVNFTVTHEPGEVTVTPVVSAP